MYAQDRSWQQGIQHQNSWQPQYNRKKACTVCKLLVHGRFNFIYFIFYLIYKTWGDVHSLEKIWRGNTVSKVVADIEDKIINWPDDPSLGTISQCFNYTIYSFCICTFPGILHLHYLSEFRNAKSPFQIKQIKEWWANINIAVRVCWCPGMKYLQKTMKFSYLQSLKKACINQI